MGCLTGRNSFKNGRLYAGKNHQKEMKKFGKKCLTNGMRCGKIRKLSARNGENNTKAKKFVKKKKILLDKWLAECYNKTVA